jgi:hypothetical protein
MSVIGQTMAQRHFHRPRAAMIDHDPQCAVLVGFPTTDVSVVVIVVYIYDVDGTVTSLDMSRMQLSCTAVSVVVSRSCLFYVPEVSYALVVGGAVV